MEYIDSDGVCNFNVLDYSINTESSTKCDNMIHGRISISKTVKC